MTKTINTIGIDQYGSVYKNLGKHPRKKLLETLSATNAQKIYVDTKQGQVKHIGYIIGGLWINLFNLTEWAK